MSTMFELLSRTTTAVVSLPLKGHWYTNLVMPHLPILVALHLSTPRTLHMGMPYGWNTIIEDPRERLQIVEGGDRYRLDIVDLCLVPKVGLPIDFKTPKFDKYKGRSYPQVHLAIYYRKMATYIYNDKIPIHCFQDSLIGAALNWYVSLERGHVKTWRDLAEAFLKQYKYNEDMVPNRSWLQNMLKKEHEGFKEYV
ncbi:hypothetical protein CR513_53575, partial [Mucuna pruriens]